MHQAISYSDKNNTLAGGTVSWYDVMLEQSTTKGVNLSDVWINVDV
jgi:hypothetical protein